MSWRKRDASMNPSRITVPATDPAMLPVPPMIIAIQQKKVTSAANWSGDRKPM